jgi:hypothetical protein
MKLLEPSGGRGLLADIASHTEDILKGTKFVQGLSEPWFAVLETDFGVGASPYPAEAPERSRAELQSAPAGTVPILSWLR